jgi:hypothetical protein
MTELRDDYVAAVEAENDTLRARIAALEDLLGMTVEAPLAFGLTGQETKLFGLLLKRELPAGAKAAARDLLPKGAAA